MKHKIMIIFSIILISIPTTIKAMEHNLYSENVILVNPKENIILYEKNKDEEVSVASLTKIMTALVALENIENIQEEIILTKEDFEGLREQNAAVAGFQIGEKVTYEDLLYGLLLPSGADAAKALCRNIAGSEENFVLKMNEKAKELNLNHTYFLNSTGLDEDGHYSTVEDIKNLLIIALENQDLKKIITSKTYTTSNNRLTFESTITKTIKKNQLEMEYLQGGKTGTTGNAGLCLATFAKQDKEELLLVTVKAPFSKTEPYAYLDAKTLYEYYFNQYDYQTLIEKGERLVTIETKYAKEESITFTSPNIIEKYIENPFDKEKVKVKYQGEIKITPNMKKGEKIGEVKIYYDNSLKETIPIFLDQNLEWSIKSILKENIPVEIGIILGIVVLLTSLIILKNKRRKKQPLMV